MLESLWQLLVGHRLDRILHGVGFQLHDAVFFGTLVGTCIVALMWMLRRAGAKDAANSWEQHIRKTAALAEREGWHSVTCWHRRFGYSPDKAVAPRPPSKTSARFNRLIAFAALAALLLIAWATR